MAVSKIKMSNARRALIQAGMSRTMARGALRLLDMNEPLKPQITALAEEDPELFGLDADGNPLDDADDTGDDDTPMTAREAQAARLLGGSQHIQRRTFRRTAQERPSTAPATAREAAAHLLKNSGRNTPPTQKWIAPVRDINTGHAPAPKRPASADALAARLRR